jgi:hypothetical protein
MIRDIQHAPKVSHNYVNIPHNTNIQQFEDNGKEKVARKEELT